VNLSIFSIPDLSQIKGSADLKSAKTGKIHILVGWVERSETHHGLFPAARPVMGFASLNPSYARLRLGPGQIPP
jgi:hypothetical protein